MLLSTIVPPTAPSRSAAISRCQSSMRAVVSIGCSARRLLPMSLLARFASWVDGLGDKPPTGMLDLPHHRTQQDPRARDSEVERRALLEYLLEEDSTCAETSGQLRGTVGSGADNRPLPRILRPRVLVHSWRRSPVVLLVGWRWPHISLCWREGRPSGSHRASKARDAAHAHSDLEPIVAGRHGHGGRSAVGDRRP